MDKENYAKALKNEDDSSIVEHALTTDGIENYAYHGDGGENNVDKEKNKNKRKSAFIIRIQNILPLHVLMIVK